MMPHGELDRLYAAHTVVSLFRLPEVPSVEEEQSLERAWRDLESAWAAMR